MTADSGVRFRAWLVVALLFVVGLLNYLDRIMITTMHGSIVSSIPMTEAQFGLLTTVFLLVYAVLSPFAGFLADRSSRSRVVIASLFFWSLVTWLTAHARTYPQLLATRALMGFSEAAYLPAALALIADYHRSETRSLATGIHLSGVLIGSALGGLGGIIAQHQGWHHAFAIFGLIGLGYSVVVLCLLRDPPRSAAASGVPAPAAEQVRFGEALAHLFRNRDFLIAVAFWGLIGLSSWAVIGWMPTYLNDQFHLGQGASGISATGFYNGAAMIGLIVGGAWADRWSRSQPRARILVPVIGLCIAAPAVFLTAVAPLFAVVAAGLAIFGFTRVFADSNMMPILCLICDRRYRATGYGLLNLCSCVIGGATVYAGGALRDAHVRVTRIFELGAVSCVACLVLLLLIRIPRSVEP